MSRYLDSFGKHGFVTTLATYSQKVEELSLVDDVEENIVLEFARLKKVISYLNDIMSSVDPELVSPHTLNDMHGNIQNSLNEFNAFISNGNLGNLQNANNHLDQVLNHISRAFVFYSKPTKSRIKDILKSYTDVLDEHLQGFKRISKEKIDEVSENANENINRLNSSIEKADSKISELNEKSKSLESELATIEQQAQTQLAEFNKQFQSTQESNQAKFDSTLEKLSNKFLELLDKKQAVIEAEIEKYKNRIDDEFAKFSVKSGTIVDVLEKLKDDAETVFGVVQNTVQAGAHKKYADAERKTANRFRYGAFGLMILAVAFLIVPELVTFVKGDKGVGEFILGIDWTALLKRLPVSAVLFAPALYLARESSQHRQNEFKNRRKELTLLTIDPYLALIEDEGKRQDLKCQIALDIFGDSNASSNKGAETSDVLAQLSNLTNNLSKFIKK